MFESDEGPPRRSLIIRLYIPVYSQPLLIWYFGSNDMQDSRWFFISALAGVLVLGLIFFIAFQHHSDPSAQGSAQSASDASSTQTLYTQGTSSAYLNPNAIPQ
jgi:threonine/homoserine/homoserine lactone efflux protein